MKILFTDVDGVLNDEATTAKSPFGYTGIMDSKVKLLKKIIDATGAKVVLSSDWRLCDDDDPDYEYLLRKLKNVGGIILYGKTPDISWERRGLEIERWLSGHPNVESWVVLDDVYFSDFQRDEFRQHVVITDYYHGLRQIDVDKAIGILNIEK
jgi:hypothetical protein